MLFWVFTSFTACLCSAAWTNSSRFLEEKRITRLKSSRPVCSVASKYRLLSSWETGRVDVLKLSPSHSSVASLDLPCCDVILGQWLGLQMYAQNPEFSREHNTSKLTNHIGVSDKGGPKALPFSSSVWMEILHLNNEIICGKPFIIGQFINQAPGNTA